MLVPIERNLVGMIADHLGRPRALVGPVHADTPSLPALIDLGDRAGLPVFAVRYAGNYSWWYVQALNAHARRWLPQPEQLSEQQWVELLYRLRGQPLPNGLFASGVEIV